MWSRPSPSPPCTQNWCPIWSRVTSGKSTVCERSRGRLLDASSRRSRGVMTAASDWFSLTFQWPRQTLLFSQSYPNVVLHLKYVLCKIFYLWLEKDFNGDHGGERSKSENPDSTEWVETREGEREGGKEGVLGIRKMLPRLPRPIFAIDSDVNVPTAAPTPTKHLSYDDFGQSSGSSQKVVKKLCHSSLEQCI